MMKVKICLLIASFLTVFFLYIVPAHADNIYTTEKMITVDLTKQLLTVWDAGKQINQTKVSTGLPKTPTVKGNYKIYRKIPSQTMSGGSSYYGRYSYKNVPAVMYFFEGYSIHGAYWHNRFGRPASHGCVNVPVAFSKWLYSWAEVGTRVEVF